MDVVYIKSGRKEWLEKKQFPDIRRKIAEITEYTRLDNLMLLSFTSAPCRKNSISEDTLTHSIDLLNYLCKHSVVYYYKILKITYLIDLVF